MRLGSELRESLTEVVSEIDPRAERVGVTEGKLVNEVLGLIEGVEKPVIDIVGRTV